MPTPIPTTSFAEPATPPRLARAAAARAAQRCSVGTPYGAAAARVRIKDLIPAGASVFTGASETLRLAGIEEDINAGRRYDAIRARGQAMNRATQLAEIWRLMSPPTSSWAASAVTETGSLVIASASGSQLPGYAGVPPRDLGRRGAEGGADRGPRCGTSRALPPTGKRRAMKVYGKPGAINRLLILNAGRTRARHRPAAP
jgi:hypothetical protein